MCKRNCEYRGGTVQKWSKGARSCSYAAEMEKTDQTYKTRTKLLWLKAEQEHPDWPRQRKQMWVIENLHGENCPFFKRKEGAKE